MRKYILYVLVAGGFSFASCDKQELRPDKEELYAKRIYIVGAQDIVIKKDIKYSDLAQEVSFSVAVGGSQLIDQDVLVTFNIDNQSAIDDYNYRYVAEGKVKYQPMDKSFYDFPETATLKAENIYQEVIFSLKKTTGLICDSIYSIPISISEVSRYEISTVNPVMLFTPNLVNDYSGSYMVMGKDGNIDGNLMEYSGARTLVATGEYSVRLYHKLTEEDVSNAKAMGVVFTINPSDNTVIVSSWQDFNVTGGGGIYDPEAESFDLWYTYKDGESEKRTELIISQKKKE